MNLLPDGLIDSDEDDLTDDKDNEIDLNLGNSTDSTQKLGRDPIGLRSPRKLRIRTGGKILCYIYIYIYLKLRYLIKIYFDT